MNNKNTDLQYLIPWMICICTYLFTDIVGLFDKSKLAYWSGGIIAEPYRIITTHFVHGNLNHLIANTFGIVIVRTSCTMMKIRSNKIILILIGILIPLQVIIFWFMDIYMYKDMMSLAIGFSGIIYGLNTFILFSSSYGKDTLLWVKLDIKKNKEVKKMMLIIITLGLFVSFLPSVSLKGHFAGIVAGLILFLI